MSDDDVQTFWVIRHGDRMDSHDRSWKKTAKHREDTPLSPVGEVQAQDVAKYLKAQCRNLKHILASPFLRTIQTSAPTSKAFNIPIKLEKSVWETGCRAPPPDHRDKDFPFDDSGYESAFEPTCGEHPSDFRPRLSRSAKTLAERFPVGAGDVAIFSHADPCAYLVTEFCGLDPTLTGPVAPCCVFKLERRRGDSVFRCVINSSISHLSVLGKTEPCHPIHFFHDWCRLFEEMRQAKLVEMTFKWPPQASELAIFQEQWALRYTRLLRDGKTDTFPVLGPSPQASRRKEPFHCLKCGVLSYVRSSLFDTAPPHHIINCWKCEGRFLLFDIPRQKQPDQDPNAT